MTLRLSLRAVACGALLAGTVPSAPAATDPAQAALPAAASAAIDAGRLAGLRWPDFSDYTGWVAGFYDARGGALAWTAAGKPTPQAREVIASSRRPATRACTPRTTTAAAGLRASRRSRRPGRRAAGRRLRRGPDRQRDALRLRPPHRPGEPERLGFHLDIEHKKYDLSALLEELVAAATSPRAWTRSNRSTSTTAR